MIEIYFVDIFVAPFSFSRQVVPVCLFLGLPRCDVDGTDSCRALIMVPVYMFFIDSQGTDKWRYRSFLFWKRVCVHGVQTYVVKIVRCGRSLLQMRPITVLPSIMEAFSNVPNLDANVSTESRLGRS